MLQHGKLCLAFGQWARIHAGKFTLYGRHFSFSSSSDSVPCIQSEIDTSPKLLGLNIFL